MHTWILILFFFGQGKSVTGIEFTTQQSCEAALSKAKELSNWTAQVEGFCAEK